MSENVEQRVIIACGGTGGHLFPGIAVAEGLRRRGHKVVLLISEKEIDALAVEGHEDLDFKKLPAIGMGRPLSMKTFRFLVASWKAYRQCRKLIREFNASVVLGMGGFTSTPPIVAGKRMGCRTFIHESNAIPGKANRITARFCDGILLGLEDCAAHFPGRTTNVVGTPVRSSFLQKVDRAEALREFGLNGDRKVLLVMGGSQGARSVNRLVCEMLGALDDKGFQVIHIAGPADHDEVSKAYSEVSLKAAVVPFLHRMNYAYAVADLAISRAGGSSLAELAFFGVPTILIPYPHAAEDHQTRNAESFSRRGAAVLAVEGELTGQKLGGIVNDFLTDSGKLEAIGTRMGELAVRDAADRICGVIEKSS